MRLPRLSLATLVVALSCRTGQPGSGSNGDDTLTSDPTDTSHEPAVTYHRDVAPILAKNCWGCHGANGIAFQTEGFEYAKANVSAIVEATASGQMPPWPPTDTCEPLQHVRELTPDELDTLSTWQEIGTPEGDPDDGVEWTRDDITDADLLVGMDEPFTPDGTTDEYHCFVIDPGITEDGWITSYQVAPGNTRIVHHVILFTDPNDIATSLDEGELGQGYTCFGDPGFWETGLIGGWVPGTSKVETPHGTGMPIAAGEKIVMQVHYYPANDPGAADQTVVGLNFADEPVLSLISYPMLDYNLNIPAGAGDHVEGATWSNTYFDVDVYGVTPHMHLLGSQIRLTNTPSDGEETCWIDIDDWDFQYQEFYWFQEPVRFERGDQLRIECRYDNSLENPDNPSDPPIDVHWGEGTTDEMCLAFVTFAF